ncbi:MAG: multicopper oxidase domain-containing protein [Alphaproteobacteria bacterium]|nr:multicopper oxidase domain-containing protein [Alphaproteobacteria bacterium]MCB9929681.1 multicopper oxidase domain-containing protein [Alphaproteobacteria bacterium]
MILSRILPAATLALAAMLPALAQAEFRHFDMTVEEVTLDVAPGFKAAVWAYNGQVPGPLIHVQEGDEVEVSLTNNTTLNHTIHWHGMHQIGTWQSDGVPDITQKAIEPGETYTYRFVADRIGTLWYHCHVNVPEHVGIRGMWGPLIVDPKDPLPIEKEVTKEAILMFSGWNPDVAMEYGKGGKPGEPISYFSINGKAFPTTQPLRVKKGDVVRLRLIAATVDVAFHLHGHDMMVTHKDGLPLPKPFMADTLHLSPGERYDVIVRANNPGRWIAHDHIEHHVSNNGKEPGGSILILEYESVERTDDWYVWKDKAYEPDFYFSESMTKGPGLFDIPVHEGEMADLRR